VLFRHGLDQELREPGVALSTYVRFASKHHGDCR
jgi:hypothetical protein